MIGTPVIALTIFDRMTKGKWDRDYIDHYIPKPESNEDLAALLTRILGEYAVQNQGRK